MEPDMNPVRTPTDNPLFPAQHSALLARDYADCAQARTALGSAWAGMIALWPISLVAIGAMMPGLRSACAERFILGLCWIAPALWVLGRGVLDRVFYRPLGRVLPVRTAREALWNTLILLVLAGTGLWSLMHFWKEIMVGLPVISPLGRAMVHRDGILMGGWLLQIGIIGWFFVRGWEERWVLLSLGFYWVWMGARASAVDPVGTISLMVGAASILGAPWLIVRGLRRHRNFRQVVAQIQALPGLE